MNNQLSETTVNYLYKTKASFETMLYKTHSKVSWNFSWDNIEYKYKNSQLDWMFFCYRKGFSAGILNELE